MWPGISGNVTGKPGFSMIHTLRCVTLAENEGAVPPFPEGVLLLTSLEQCVYTEREQDSA